MTFGQTLMTIGICILATVLTRFLPFIIFSDSKPTPDWVRYLGKVLPPAIFSLLLVYCLREVDFLSGNHGLPEIMSLLVTLGLHQWKGKMLFSLFGGTIVYMGLVQYLFI